MTDDPAPREAESNRARDRLGLITGMRVGGVILMLLGIWLWLGGSIAGHYGFGTVLFVVGAIEGIAAPALLAKRWNPPE